MTASSACNIKICWMFDLCFARVMYLFEFSNIMTLNSIVNPQVLNKYLVLVDVKSGDLSTKAGERETRQKSVSLPPKAGELASMI